VGVDAAGGGAGAAVHAAPPRAIDQAPQGCGRLRRPRRLFRRGSDDCAGRVGHCIDCPRLGRVRRHRLPGRVVRDATRAVRRPPPVTVDDVAGTIQEARGEHRPTSRVASAALPFRLHAIRPTAAAAPWRTRGQGHRARDEH